MTPGDIAGLIAAGAFLLLVLFIGGVLWKVAKVLDDLSEGVRGSFASIEPTLAETQETVRQTNTQLAKLDEITNHLQDTTSNVSSLVALTAATVGGPLIKLAGFSAAVKAGISGLKPSKRTSSKH